MVNEWDDVLSIYLHLAYTDAEVGLVEFIRHIPAQRAKFTTFLNQCMEEAQSK